MFDINGLFPNGLSVNDAIDLLQPVTLYVIGVAVYAVFVFNFYRFVALRDMFQFDVYRFEESRYRALRSFLHHRFVHPEVSDRVPFVRVLLVRSAYLDAGRFCRRIETLRTRC